MARARFDPRTVQAARARRARVRWVVPPSNPSRPAPRATQVSVTVPVKGSLALALNGGAVVRGRR